MPAVIKQINDRHAHLEFEAVGTLAEVLETVRGEFINYDPRGYDTSVSSIHLGPEGKYCARWSRMSSCD